MKDTLRVAGAYVGTIIGAGYASGQEILQFFTSYGWWGIVGSLITMGLYPLLGYYLVVLGDKLQASSHKTVVYQICGKYLGFIIDILLAFFLFGVGVIMVAGSGSLVAQQFGLPPIIGYIVLTVMAILALLLSLRRIVTVISWISPFAFLLIIVLSIYSVTVASPASTQELDSIAGTQLSASPHWLLSAFLHVSFNVSVAFAIMAMIGAREKNKKAARRGAVLGGLVLGIIAVIINIAVYANIEILQDSEMPMLLLATDIAPVVGTVLAIVLFGMIFNTAVPCLYSFTARFVQADTRQFKVAAVVVGLAAFSLGFIGFTELVNTVYPLLGYVGFVLIGSLAIYVFRTRKQEAKVDDSRETEDISGVADK